jgi:BirA family transcriptional regulator, biotin operon repressor / biotin---[acetyl-CoA-carboxylase] ligase
MTIADNLSEQNEAKVHPQGPSMRGTLTPTGIRQGLQSQLYGRSLDVREQTASTNDDAREAALAGAPRGHAVVADRQSAGRGARGRAWSSVGGVDAYISVVERVNLEPRALAPLTLALGLGVADAVDACLGSARARVKWPNDVLVEGRKLAGILVETSSIGGTIDFAVVGVGLGINREHFEDELEASATSLARVLGGPLDRGHVVGTLLSALEARADAFFATGFAPMRREFETRMAFRGEVVQLDDERGVLVGITDQGLIRLQTDVGDLERAAGTLRLAGAVRTE